MLRQRSNEKDTSSKQTKAQKTKTTASKKQMIKSRPQNLLKEIKPETKVLKAKEVKAESEGPAVKEKRLPKPPRRKQKARPEKRGVFHRWN